MNRGKPRKHAVSEAGVVPEIGTCQLSNTSVQRDGWANPPRSLVPLIMDETRITKQGFTHTHTEFLYLNSVDVVRVGWTRTLGSIPGTEAQSGSNPMDARGSV
jgi:hypothetical protein